MSESQWCFECAFGLAQDDCGEYQADEKARGYGRYSGCCSCVHRRPANAATEAAELAWDTREVVK